VSFPKVSVIVPAYNAAETIRACIDSLLELNYPKAELELVVVNNASSDHTASILKEYGERIRILQESKRGPAAARNRGIRGATGNVVAFTDADCIVDKDWLHYLVPLLREPAIGIVGGAILAKRPCNEIARFGEAIHDHDLAINAYKPPAVITMNWASRSSVLREVNLFDESFIRCEDVDLSYRILQAGYRFAFRAEAVVYHQNEDTLSGLFHEGLLHGWYGVQALKKHREFVQAFGHRKFNGSSYRAIVSHLRRFCSGKESDASLCFVVFNAGKKIGKIAGSIRFGHLDL
jgi:glycosyltransferase involved in cell wall biosynthesis